MLFADTIDPVLREKEDEFFFVCIEAVPADNNPEAEEFGGAFVNAWVDAPSLRDAEQMTIDRIEFEGWSPRRFDHWEIVCRECYSPDSHGEAAYQNAIEGIQTASQHQVGLIFHTWPVDETEDEISAEP